MARPAGWVRAWWPAVACMLLIWTLSSLSRPPSTASFPFKDKGVHAIEYAALAVLTARGMLATFVPGAGARLVVYNVTLCTFWALTDEIHQAYVPDRSAEIADVFADALGATLGTLGYLLLHRRRRQRDAGAETRGTP